MRALLEFGLSQGVLKSGDTYSQITRTLANSNQNRFPLDFRHTLL